MNLVDYAMDHRIEIGFIFFLVMHASITYYVLVAKGVIG